MPLLDLYCQFNLILASNLKSGTEASLNWYREVAGDLRRNVRPFLLCLVLFSYYWGGGKQTKAEMQPSTTFPWQNTDRETVKKQKFKLCCVRIVQGQLHQQKLAVKEYKHGINLRIFLQKLENEEGTAWMAPGLAVSAGSSPDEIVKFSGLGAC